MALPIRIRIQMFIEIQRDDGTEISTEDGWPVDVAEFGRAVCQARQSAGLTRAALAKKVGVTEVTIHNIELGKLPSRREVREWLKFALAPYHQKGKTPAST